MNLHCLRALPIVVFCLLAARAAADAKDTAPKQVLYVIPHSHWEGAVFKTREEYLQMGLPNILRALQLLKKHPEYRFVLDQVAYVKPFLERFPEEEPAFRRFVEEGRLQLVLGMDIMPDVNLPGGESFVRQIQYGKRYYRERLGVDVKLAWLVDTFGHHGQMPQILKLAGYETFWFSRGVPKNEHPSEFVWEGIDGTRIDSYFLPFSYVLFWGAGPDAEAFKGFAEQRFNMLNPNARGSLVRAAATGGDVTEPEWHYPPTVAKYNTWKDRPIDLRFGTPGDYEAAFNKTPQAAERPVFKGEFNPVFQGTYSSRIELKQWMRSSQERLTIAEKLSSLAVMLGSPADTQQLWRAWEPVLFNETHDLASGVMTDHVYRDTIRGYEFSKSLAEDVTDERWEVLANQIDTRGEGAAVVVFNTLGWPRSDLAEATIGFTETGVTDVTLIGPDGRETPVQLSDVVAYAPEGGMRRAKVSFIAKGVPAMGYATYHAVGKKAPPLAAPPPAKPDEMENELYRLKFDLATGEMKSLVVKEGEWELFPGGGGNVVSRQDDKGDLWELYKGLNGAQKLAMTDVQTVPKAPESKLSNQFKGADAGTIKAGPVYSEFDVWHPFDTGTFATRVRLYSGIRRIDVRTQLINQSRKVRYQALFPTGIKDGKSVHAIPFGVIERPLGVEFPAQEWVDYGDGKRGVALLNVGHPGNVATADGTLMLSLMRAHDLGAYGFGGGYEPGVSSESGMQLGRQFTLNYALVPHKGSWQDARVYRDGVEFNNPLVVRRVAAHAGKMPARWGLLEVSQPNVLLSALTPGANGTTVLRVFETAGADTPDVRVKFNAKLGGVVEVNLMEDPVGGAIAAGDDSIRFHLKPYEIKTFRFGLQPSLPN